MVKRRGDKLKKIEYKGKKWDKKKEKEKNVSYQEIINSLESLEELWKKGGCEEILYHLSKASKMLLLAKSTYIIGELNKCQEYMDMLVDETILTCKLYEDGTDVARGVSETIKSLMDNGVEAYYAMAINRNSDLEKITTTNHILRKLVNKEYETIKDNCREGEPIDGMLMAICENDNTKFEVALVERIKEIRKISMDYMIIIDIWSVVLVPIAKRHGMDFYCNYIEVPDFLLN